MTASVLVTGGAGYIGSHAALRLIREGRRVVVVDDLSRGHRGAIERIVGVVEGAEDRLAFVQADISETDLLVGLMREHAVESVLHFAGLAVVGESVERPGMYYRCNTAGSIALLDACAQAGVERLVFSSTAATYGMPDASSIPIRETTPQRPINPYGRSKLAVEWALREQVEASRAADGGGGFSAAALRYFNVAGCDGAGILGEHHDPETHLIPVVVRHLLGQQGEAITVFGADYDTPDGTCVRDYIHVDDLIDAHLAVLDGLGSGGGEYRAYNLGLGRGHSVREIIEAAERVSGKRCVVREGPRRAGDPPVLYTDPSLIRAELGWEPKVCDLDEIIASAWRWFEANPERYGAETRASV